MQFQLLLRAHFVGSAESRKQAVLVHGDAVDLFAPHSIHVHHPASRRRFARHSAPRRIARNLHGALRRGRVYVQLKLGIALPEVI